VDPPVGCATDPTYKVNYIRWTSESDVGPMSLNDSTEDATLRILPTATHNITVIIWLPIQDLTSKMA